MATLLLLLAALIHPQPRALASAAVCGHITKAELFTDLEFLGGQYRYTYNVTLAEGKTILVDAQLVTLSTAMGLGLKACFGPAEKGRDTKDREFPTWTFSSVEKN